MSHFCETFRLRTTFTRSIVAMSDSVCWFWIFLMSPLPGMLFIKIIWNYCALLQRSNQLWQMQTITLPLWYYPSESEGNSLCYTMAWPLKFHRLFPPPVIVPIVWVRRVMADLELGQSLDWGWLLQGSTPSDAKAAWGLNGSQPRHLGTKASYTHLCLLQNSW